ncbi:methionine ABC transporter ATP-binding protein [Alteromonas sp. KUL42]|uniref:ABC transporter ATP-binding protein n=1 Tax=Alteromonas sp. KUL42 TaxID=2480797 RepID=UPI0010369907|nr:ABC transporter ATP-binding protein [Alteromonas sp. KUL42]TAP33062.1 ABC transporter ATP-binding protein [Alteromonas sp. KUL42]GEA08662.1 methionine ABC transporter ATP-binding protein [Alteromonas sp. KUL42]
MSVVANTSSNTLSELAVDIRHLRFAYTNSDAPVISIDKWQVRRGEHVFLFGPSGSGKSTLLNLLSGTLTTSSGIISLLGESFSTLSNRQRDRFRAQHIGVVFQQFNLIPYLSVEQNIRAAAYFAHSKLRNDALSKKMEDLLKRLQLPSNVLNAKADALSIGQQQRVAIARALINSPQLLIVDEPTSALDVNARDSFMALLKSVAKESTLIFVSHDPAMANYFDTQIDIQTLHASKSTDALHEIKEGISC